VPENVVIHARFVPAVGIVAEPKWAERLLALADTARRAAAPEEAKPEALAA
jgi:hypothetical protein